MIAIHYVVILFILNLSNFVKNSLSVLNYLAHSYLSFTHDDRMIGNFIADHVKGNHISKFREGIIEGILLHRKIDAFTDTHPVFLKSKRRLQSKYGKYKGVVIDMYYDHFLASNWCLYSDENIHEFTRKNYMVLMKNYLILPPKTKRLLPFMMRSNWLASYASLNFLKKSFEGIAFRSTFKSGMEHAVMDLKSDYEGFLGDFRSFFPEIIEYTINEIKSNSFPNRT